MGSAVVSGGAAVFVLSAVIHRLLWFFRQPEPVRKTLGLKDRLLH
jgi:hypothetical protein